MVLIEKKGTEEREKKERRREDVMEKKGLGARAPGSTRELELVRVRAMECNRWGSAAPECVRVRESEVATGRVPPLAEAEEMRWTFFLMAGLNGLAVVAAPVVVCLRCGCGVCVRGGRWTGGWDGADWRADGAV